MSVKRHRTGKTVEAGAESKLRVGGDVSGTVLPKHDQGESVKASRRQTIKPSAAREILLQYHQEMITRLGYMDELNRTICCIFGGSIAFLQIPLNQLSLGAVLGSALCMVWMFKKMHVRSRLKLLEESITRTAGGAWEDLFIRLKFPTETRLPLAPLEPVMWIAGFFCLLAARFWLDSAVITFGSP